MWAVIKKELKYYFCTPIGYVFIGIFLIAFSVSFYFTVIGYGNVNFEYIFYSTPTIFVLAFLIPLLTMRSFSEERKSGTEQLLLTSPLSITKIVLAKFIAALLVGVITAICTLMYFAILCYFGVPHITTALTALLGFVLFVMAYISFGMLMSSITENQIIAAIITIVVLVAPWFLVDISEIFSSIDLIDKFMKFPNGLISVADLVSLVSITVMCILITIIVIKRRKTVK